MACKELAVFAREDVVCYGCDVVLISEGEAEGEHQGCFAGADGSGISVFFLVFVHGWYWFSIVPADAHGEGTLVPVSSFNNGHFAAEERARTVKDFMRVAMISGRVGVGLPAFVRVRHCADKR